MVCPILLLIALGVITGQTSGTGPCRDIHNRNNFCRRVLNGGWCDSWGWAKQNCKKTCGHCRGMVQSNIMEDVSDYELGCGLSATTENGNDYIIGGDKVVGNPYPWMARIYGGCAGGFCAGTLITKRHLLTAFHCTTRRRDDREPCDHSDGKRKAVFGTTEFIYTWWKLKSYNTIPIIDILYPKDVPLNEGIANTHDFAMAVLKEDVEWSEKVRPICLPKKGDWFYGKHTVAAGWGRFIAGEHGKQSPHLRSVDLTISHTRFAHFKMFGTAVGPAHSPKDPCSGDSGGPLMYKDPASNRWVIVGTVFGAGFNCRWEYIYPFEGFKEGIWNMVSYHADWIKKAIQQ